MLYCKLKCWKKSPHALPLPLDSKEWEHEYKSLHKKRMPFAEFFSKVLHSFFAYLREGHYCKRYHYKQHHNSKDTCSNMIFSSFFLLSVNSLTKYVRPNPILCPSDKNCCKYRQFSSYRHKLFNENRAVR